MNAITLRKIVKFSSNRKKQVYNLESAATVLRRSIFLFVYLLFSIQLLAQDADTVVVTPADSLFAKPSLADTTLLQSDSLALLSNAILSDSTLLASDTTLGEADTTVVAQQEGDIETTINYSANDSLKFGMDQKTVYLYGGAVVDYGSIKLEAEEIEIDWNTSTVTARGVTDSLGNKVGMPVFHNGTEVYVTKGMKYNFDTGRAIISEVVTQQGEGYMHGSEVFKNEDNELFSIGNSYTTCNREVPHYSIKSRKTKAIPDDKIVSSWFNLEINEVPTPLGFFFGMFPMQKGSTSGLIIPTYGEERIRGFYLRDGGYFFDINEYIKVKLTGDIYSKGSSGLRLAVPYKKRYRYNGNFNFVFVKSKLKETIEDEGTKNDFQLRWNHSPQSKRNSRFSASVNAATSTYSENNVLSVNQNTNRKLSSTISYSKTFGNTPFSMGLNMRHQQDIATKQVDLTLPDLSVNMNNIYPFKGKNGESKTWYQKMALRWTMNGTNQLSNNLGRIGSDPKEDSIAQFNGDNIPIFFDDSKKGFKHVIPLSTSLKVLKYFTLSPSLNYTERWYFDKLDWRLDETDSSLVADTTAGFNRVYDYGGGLGLNTRVYGTYHFKKGSIKAIRHVVNPSISFSYKPDFSDPEEFDFYQVIDVPTKEGTVKEVYKSRHEGRNYVYGAPGTGKTESIGFSLNNNLEMKYHSKKDTTDEFRKIPLLNNFGFSTSYNLAADSFKLAPISLKANTSLFNNKLALSYTGAIDPYFYEKDAEGLVDKGFKKDIYAWNKEKGIGQLSASSISLSTNFSAKAREKDAELNDKVENSDLTDDQKENLLNNAEAYVDFDIPWSMRVNFNMSYSKVGHEKSSFTTSLNFSGDFSLSEKWKISYTSGYDFKSQDFTRTSLGIHRDLHCWEMNLNWVPFGRQQSYNFEIRVKSALLQDLKLNKHRNFRDIAF